MTCSYISNYEVFQIQNTLIHFWCNLFHQVSWRALTDLWEGHYHCFWPLFARQAQLIVQHFKSVRWWIFLRRWQLFLYKNDLVSKWAHFSISKGLKYHLYEQRTKPVVQCRKHPQLGSLRMRTSIWLAVWAVLWEGGLVHFWFWAGWPVGRFFSLQASRSSSAHPSLYRILILISM